MDEKISLGGRDFTVPQFPIWAQRTLTPRLLAMTGKLDSLDDPKTFGELLDIVYDALTIGTVDGKKNGQKINDISKQDFEDLPILAMDLAQNVIPTLLVRIGLAKKKPNEPVGGAGAAVPDTPLDGATTSTTSSPDTSSA